MFNKAIISGKICPYCGKKTEYVDGKRIYGTGMYGMLYVCFKCNAWVGCHKGTNKALGRLANQELRNWKIEAHHSFDSLWKNSTRSTSSLSKYRKKAYIWLSNKMGIKEQYCHIGMFDVEQCKQVVKICKEHGNEFISPLILSCEKIDFEIRNKPDLYDDDYRSEFKLYIKRWNKEINEIEKIIRQEEEYGEV